MSSILQKIALLRIRVSKTILPVTTISVETKWCGRFSLLMVVLRGTLDTAFEKIRILLGSST